jgi:pyruvate dehydrogenase E2 component (dihydrolipoamide acetyltransferase)
VDGFVSARRRADMSAVVSQLFADPSLATRDMAEALLRYKRLDGVDAALKAIIAANFEGGRQHRADPDGWKTVAAPLLVLWGAEDRIIPRAHIDRAPSTAKKEVLPGAGHLPHLEKADAVNALLAAHIGAVAEA